METAPRPRTGTSRGLDLVVAGFLSRPGVPARIAAFDRRAKKIYRTDLDFCRLDTAEPPASWSTGTAIRWCWRGSWPCAPGIAVWGTSEQPPLRPVEQGNYLGFGVRQAFGLWIVSGTSPGPAASRSKSPATPARHRGTRPYERPVAGLLRRRSFPVAFFHAGRFSGLNEDVEYKPAKTTARPGRSCSDDCSPKQSC